MITDWSKNTSIPPIATFSYDLPNISVLYFLDYERNSNTMEEFRYYLPNCKAK